MQVTKYLPQRSVRKPTQSLSPDQERKRAH